MGIYRLVAVINASRAREDHLYRKSPEIRKGILARSEITFEFMGARFVTDLPYGLRLTIGSVIEHLNGSRTFLIEENSLTRVIFTKSLIGEVSWTAI